jgi:hypothetical protein
LKAFWAAVWVVEIPLVAATALTVLAGLSTSPALASPVQTKVEGMDFRSGYMTASSESIYQHSDNQI